MRGQNDDGKCSLCHAGASIDFLQVETRMDVAQEELRDPLVLLVAARAAPGQVRLAVAQRHGGRQRRARPLAGNQSGRMRLVEPEHLRARSEREAEFGDDRRTLQPSAGGGRGDHVAVLVDDVEVNCIAIGIADPADRRLAGTEGTDRNAALGRGARIDKTAESVDLSRPQLERCGIADQLATRSIVFLRQQRLDGDRAKFGSP